MIEEADVTDVIDPREWPDASEETEEDELLLDMKAGRGGASEVNTIEPCSSVRISRL